MCALHVSPVPMFRGSAMPPAPYPPQNRSRPEAFPPCAAPEHFSTEQFAKRRRVSPSPDQMNQPPKRSYPPHPVSSRGIHFSGSNPEMSNMDPRASYHPRQHHNGFDDPRAPRYAPMESLRDRRVLQASSPSLPGVSALLKSSNSPPPHHLRRPDAPPISVPRMHSNGLAHGHRTTSWSSNGSPTDSPLVSRGPAMTGRPHWGSPDDRHRDLRQGYPLNYYHQQVHPSHRPEQIPSRRAPSPLDATGSVSPSSRSGDETVEDGRTTNGSVNAKNSRYLREMDRRAILERLANGEKQAALAKEFQVSRAAICNLNKHRHEVMSRSDENPFAKHPKKRKARSISQTPVVNQINGHVKEETAPDNNNAAAKEPAALTAVHVVQSRAVQLLMTTLRSHITPLTEFRRASERIMRLVIEDALALVPTKPVDVYLNDQVKVEGVGMEHAPCGISMEQRHCPMMDMFHLIEPDQPTGYVRVGAGFRGDPKPSITLLDAHLPGSLRFHNVFLFDLVATSGETLCAIIQELKDRGAVESMLHVVALFVSSDVVASIQCTFPSVRIVTAQIDASLSKKTQRGSHLDGILTRFGQVYGDGTV